MTGYGRSWDASCITIKLFSTSICEVIMNILPSFCKLNRFFRRQMHHYFQEFPFDGYMTDDELDDIDNMYAGCAFE